MFFSQFRITALSTPFFITVVLTLLFSTALNIINVVVYLMLKVTLSELSCWFFHLKHYVIHMYSHWNYCSTYSNSLIVFHFTFFLPYVKYLIKIRFYLNINLWNLLVHHRPLILLHKELVLQTACTVMRLTIWLFA